MDFNDPPDDFLLKHFELWDPFFLRNYFQDEMDFVDESNHLSNSQPLTDEDLVLAKALQDYEDK